MYDGRVVQMGTPEELFEAPAHTFVGYFIGSPGMNFLNADVQGNRATLPGGEVVALGASYAPLKGQVQIGIRPEHAMLVADGGLPFNIRRIEDVGRHRLLRGEVLGNALNVVVPEGMPVEGLPRVAFAPEKINVYADDWRVAPAQERAA